MVEDLGLSIISGRQPEGTLLPGDGELMERYGVSRTVLREALKTLSAKGLIQAKARIGTRVRSRHEWNLFDPEVLIWHARTGFARGFLVHLGEMRLALEPEAAALAARRRSPEEMAAIWAWLERMGDPNILHEDFVQADFGLHLAIVEAAGNPFFRSVSTLIEVALVEMLRASSPVDNAQRLVESVAQHRDIVVAIEKGDPETARTSMQFVIQTGINNSRI